MRVAAVVEVERMRRGAVDERGAEDVGPAVVAEDQRAARSCGMQNSPAHRRCGLGVSTGDRYADGIENAFLGSLDGQCRQSPELDVENRGGDLTQ